MVPKNMKRDILYPLNILKKKYPDIYDEQSSKYLGRENVMKQVIPTLNCLWNDALHFSAVPPKDVKDAIIEAGGDKNFKMICYQIDPNLLEPEKTTVFLNSEPVSGGMHEKFFLPYKPDEIGKYSILPQETKDYYKRSYDKDEKPLRFHKVIHILYKGSLNIKNCPIIEV